MSGALLTRAIRPSTPAAAADLANGAPLAALQAHVELLRPRQAAAAARALRGLAATGDRLARGLALRPLALVAGEEYDVVLLAHASGDDPFLREQALAGLSDRRPTGPALRVVVGAVADGGHAGVLAQLTLERWARRDGSILEPVAAELGRRMDVAERRRLVEAWGAADHPARAVLLSALLRSREEHDGVRAAAALALAGRPVPELLDDLWRAGADGGPELRFAAARALRAIGGRRGHDAAAALARSAARSDEPYDRLLASLGQGRPAPSWGSVPGLRIAQIFLQGRLDAELSSAGAGDGGGISTLLVQLGRALGAAPEVGSVVTIARALAEPETDWRHVQETEPIGPRSSIERIAFGPAGSLPAAAMWEHRLELEAMLAAALARIERVDVAHLRFADAGSFAAARVCRRLGIPVVFTAAPDPHGVIRGAELRGELTRAGFPDAELAEHYLMRAELVATLLGRASATVVLPRPRARAALRTLIGPAFARLPAGAVHTIPEGISLAAVDRAHAELAADGRARPLPAAATALLERVAGLPSVRHGLPLLASVGRLHPVKGLPLLLEAWASDDELHAGLNLVIVGGGLEQPTEVEQAVLRELEAICARIPRAADGLVLLGHRPNGEVATILRIVRDGLGELVARDGVYACTSRKEEFGVALLEAMATGLAVVAPNAGGPATYVHEGLTGFVADTSSLDDVQAALRRAVAARADAARAERASATVRSRYTIEAMADALADVYGTVADTREQVAA